MVLFGTRSQRVNEISELLPEWGDLHVIWSFYSRKVVLYSFI